MMKRKLHSVKGFILLICALIFSTQALAQDASASTIQEEKKLERMRFFALVDFANITNPDTGTSGAGVVIGANFLYAYDKKIGFGGELAGNSIYKNFDVNATYALTGSLIREQRKIKINGKQAIKIKDHGASGFRFQGGASQYYFNSKTGKTLSYSGLSVGGYYEFITKKKWSIIVGAKYKSLAGGNDTSITFYSAYGGLGFWF